MAYFANGSEGSMFEEQFCSRCVHEKPDDGGCMVWLLHLLWNYDAVGKDADETKHMALDLLMPDGKTATELPTCSMFYAIGEERDA